MPTLTELYEKFGDKMDIGWLMFGFFIFVTMLFMVIAFFLPEWVWITGKKAQEILKEQQGDSVPSSLSNESTKTPTEQ